MKKIWNCFGVKLKLFKASEVDPYSEAAERTKKLGGGAENKIGHSIFFPSGGGGA